MMAEPPRKETISSRISAVLRDSILRGDLAPGAKINLDRLRETHGISISPLREAVARLVADGLVAFEDQRGYRVAPVSLVDLAEVTALRAELEVMALRASIERGDLDWESDVMRALYLVTHTECDSTRPDTVTAWETAHTDFHMALIRGCNMPILLNFCAVLHNMNDRYHHLLPALPLDARNVNQEHDAIAQSAVGHDAEQACAALRAHILNTGKHLKGALAGHLGGAQL